MRAIKELSKRHGRVVWEDILDETLGRLNRKWVDEQEGGGGGGVKGWPGEEVKGGEGREERGDMD
jgi:hypothetical protein